MSNTILCAKTLIVNDGLTPLRGRRRSGADVRIEESFIKQSHRSFLTKVNKYDGKYKTFYNTLALLKGESNSTN